MRYKQADEVRFTGTHFVLEPHEKVLDVKLSENKTHLVPIPLTPRKKRK